MSGLKHYWQGLETRERRILLLGGSIAFIVLFYSLLWEPWHEHINALRKETPAKFMDLVWLTYQKDHLRGLNKNRQQANITKPASMLTFLEQSAKKYGLGASLNISPGRSNQTRVTLKKVSFDQALSWLQNLTKAGFKLNALLFKSSDEPGQVDVTLTVAG